MFYFSLMFSPPKHSKSEDTPNTQQQVSNKINTTKNGGNPLNPISLYMLKFCSFLAIPNRPKIPLLFFHFSKPNPPKATTFFVTFLFTSRGKPNMPTKIIAEYAKSGRSSCKGCGKAIIAQALRLGLVTRDARGFDMTKWYHLDCSPEKVDSLDAINGFALLKGVDQEALKKLAEVSDKSPKQLQEKEDEEEEEEEENELEKSNSKKIKLSVPDEKAELDIAFSATDVKYKYKDAALEPKWKAFQTIIFLERDDGLHDSGKIAAFDFDGCLAKTSVKRIGADAWSLMYPSIPEKLQSLYEEGYKLVIFTNESNIDRWKNKRQVAVDSKIGRLNNFIKQVKVPMQVFIACGIGSSGGKTDDPFRKPNPGMWHIMEKHFNSGIPIDMDQAFYVGDAAGRPGDHSDADIKFAQAIGLRFYVPEDYFIT